ncbi:MAG: hypothetical protein KatS3mg087_0584 [Patescibacteria group bacterium]|nr:MAG: hypothetical protein KatS3mg087_0584 [Patescibacteria group bacterium]
MYAKNMSKQSDRRINIRLPKEEMDLLESYCAEVSLGKTAVIRGLVRSLQRKVKKVVR